jgi:hypothetical protein
MLAPSKGRVPPLQRSAVTLGRRAICHRVQQEILPSRSFPPGHRVVTTRPLPLKARVEQLEAGLAKVEAAATGHRTDFESRLRLGYQSFA